MPFEGRGFMAGSRSFFYRGTLPVVFIIVNVLLCLTSSAELSAERATEFSRIGDWSMMRCRIATGSLSIAYIAGAYNK